MERVLIIGASSETSIGYMLGETLRELGMSIHYASRTGKLGTACNITNEKETKELIQCSVPTHIVLAAGQFTQPHPLGTALDSHMQHHILAKSVGAINVLNEAVQTTSVRTLLLLGGREVSDDPSFIVYTVSNGALWGLTQFARQHVKRPVVYYLDLPFVAGSTMEAHYQQTQGGQHAYPTVGMQEVRTAVRNALAHRYRGGQRIVLGPHNAA